MVNAASAAALVDLCAGLIALEIFCFLDPQQQQGAGTAPSAQAPLLDSALGLLVPLGAAGLLLAAVASIHRRLSHGAVPAPDGRRLSGLVNFILCVAAGILNFYFSAQPAGGRADHVAQARALGLAAHRALPAAATATFFWGMMLIIVAHVRAGGEGGGGGAGAGAGHGAAQGAARFLTKVGLGAAAGIVFLIAMALGVKY